MISLIFIRDPCKSDRSNHNKIQNIVHQIPPLITLVKIVRYENLNESKAFLSSFSKILQKCT